MLWILICGHVSAEDTLPALADGFVPSTVEELWRGFDPRKEPLDVEVLKEWEEEGVILKIIRYRVGIFKGEKAMMAAVYGYPKGAKDLPAVVQIHGGGQSAQDAFVLANAKNGYATLSIAWAGRIQSSHYTVTNKEKEMFWTGDTKHPDYRVTTDWGAVDGYHHHCRFKGNNFVQNPPSESTVDPVHSPRNSGWFLVTMGARRAITFLEQQAEVDADRIGVYGMSMGGKLTVLLAGADDRLKAAVPACGGISDFSTSGRRTLAPIADEYSLKRITCPIIFMSPSNDFHGKVEDLPQAVRDIQSQEWRIVSSPNRNHSDSPEYAAGGMLWFEQFLKGGFSMPNTPTGTLKLDTVNNVPTFTVSPDHSRKVLSVEIYYTTDGEEEPVDRFWRLASSTEQAGAWNAQVPVSGIDKPLWVYADVTYALEESISGVGYSGARFSTDRFHLASVVQMVRADELKASGVVATLRPPEVLETFEDGWEGWSQDGTFHRYRKRMFQLSEYQAPSSQAELVVEVRAERPNTLIIAIDKHVAEVALTGGSEWQKIALQPADFDNGDGGKLPSWEGIKEIMIGEFKRFGKKNKLFGAPWQGKKAELRNLRWAE
ncbi:MAG: alpha/beta hydrolase family protein [Opitutales bacterium]